MFWATVGIGCIGLLQLVAFIAQAIYIRVSAKAGNARADRVPGSLA
jgi:hypothetical protein